ncbi:low temperature requirement protein A [Brevibacterium sp. ZH18]|uniref:low temperature requirement protein A n=1 Tax=Brevibacterium sp. ZH18 TaxID=2927784 RepID=UPI001F600F21|nr:low temperature requirement protein A [Brevibacterium sp. ZH18]MCI4012318.1 low temperature requirement protein A [Brevibacterium sp. ZH18]
MIFFAIWWAWMNFTWFATSFDTDDWLYRVLTIVQMGGVLILAAGIEPIFADGNFLVLILGYILMRLVMIIQWLRASRHAGKAQRATIVYACGIGIVQVLWVGWMFIGDPTLSLVGFLVLDESILASANAVFGPSKTLPMSSPSPHSASSASAAAPNTATATTSTSPRPERSLQEWH